LRKVIAVLAAAAAFAVAPGAYAAGWTTSVPFTNQLASSPTTGWGYPDVNGVPVPGNCAPGVFNSNRSESWLAVEPGTENLVGTSKFFLGKWSTFYNFYLGSYTIPNGSVASNAGLPGYDCVTTGSQDMPPSWTNNTDPNVAFDSQGRAYQATLPFNAFSTNLHPNGAIGADYSDDLGRTWTRSTGTASFGYLEFPSNQSSFAFGGFEDKQWIAADPYVLTPNRDHVYAMWAVFNGDAIKLRESVSRDRGLTFSAPVTISMPSQTGPATTYVYPSVAPDGTLYVALASFATKSGAIDADIFVTKSVDDGVTFGPWVKVARATGNPGDFVNGNFRDGILESFATSQTFAGHLYVAYEDWNGTTMDVMFSQSVDGGATWSKPVPVNDAATVDDSTDQFQPSVAAGPGGLVAVAFYDRRGACPSDRSVPAADAGASNTCISTSLQVYKESATGLATPVGTNVDVSKFAWDPNDPTQHVDGIGQKACSAFDDPCTETFIGDYFGLAVSAGNIYTLSVSTHYASSVTADEGGPVFYQQQVLARVPRSGFGF
jgi:hypothetical protein